MILLYISCFFILCFLLYNLVPTFICYARWKFNRRAQPQNEKNIFLTIDDGPDENYTPHILDILKEYNIKAAFFVIAKKALQNQAIIKRMLEDGHIIALHSLEHKSVWTKGYRYLENDFKKSIDILKRLGCDPRFYRPPWGQINFCSLRLIKKYGMRIVLWDVIVQDWKKSSTGIMIAGKLLKQTKSNSCICLHDSSDKKIPTDADREKTIRALRYFIPIMLNEGYVFALKSDFSESP